MLEANSRPQHPRINRETVLISARISEGMSSENPVKQIQRRLSLRKTRYGYTGVLWVSMPAGTISHTVMVARIVLLCVVYAYTLWRLFKDNPENRLIRCGVITITLLLVMGALANSKVPLEYWSWLGPALFLLCLLTIFFLFQRMYRAIRRRFADRSVTPKS